MFFLAIFIAIILIIVVVFLVNNSYVHAVKKAAESIISSLNEAAVAVDTKQNIIIFNAIAEKMMGISSKDAIGKSIDTIIKVSQDKVLLPFSSYSKFEGDTGIQSRTLSLQIGIENIQIMLTTSHHSLGAQKATLITFIDTSQEQQLEEMKVDFVSMAAHELRTPLTAIRGYASLMQMHYANQLDDAARELLTRLIVSTANLTNLIDNLLSVSRIERNNLTIEVKPLDLGIIIKDIFTSYEQEATTKRQHFTLNMPDKLPMVMADPFRIGQVLINLIGNALTYTPDGGTVTVTVTNKSDNLEISVQDTGEGIPQEALPRLFTKFFRVSGSLEQGSKGSGLGLYITKSIVDLHHGKIWAESNLGKGSTFIFTLPIATEEQIKLQDLQKASNAFLTVKNGQGIIIRNKATGNW